MHPTQACSDGSPLPRHPSWLQPLQRTARPSGYLREGRPTGDGGRRGDRHLAPWLPEGAGSFVTGFF